MGGKIKVRELFGNVNGDYLKWSNVNFLPFRNLWRAREHNLLVKGYTLFESFFISSGKTFFHNCEDFKATVKFDLISFVMSDSSVDSLS